MLSTNYCEFWEDVIHSCLMQQLQPVADIEIQWIHLRNFDRFWIQLNDGIQFIKSFVLYSGDFLTCLRVLSKLQCYSWSGCVPPDLCVNGHCMRYLGNMESSMVPSWLTRIHVQVEGKSDKKILSVFRLILGNTWEFGIQCVVDVVLKNHGVDTVNFEI